jgi:hypothetical protein
MWNKLLLVGVGLLILGVGIMITLGGCVSTQVTTSDCEDSRPVAIIKTY